MEIKVLLYNFAMGRGQLRFKRACPESRPKSA
jgi:hypothetical protein